MADFERDSSLSSKNMYINEVYSYPRLSLQEEKYCINILKNRDNKKLLSFNCIDNCSLPTLNVIVLFCSLCDNLSYKSIINDLIAFYDGLNSSSDKTIDMLIKYQRESNKIGRPLNIIELYKMFNFSFDKNTCILSAEDLLSEIEEFKKYKLAFKKMFEGNLRLVLSVAAKQKSNIDIMDLIAEGNIGLMKAINGFDVSLGYKFSTYAVAAIRQNIRRYITNYRSAVKLPEYIGQEVYEFRKKISEIEQKECCELRMGEIAEKLDIPIEKVENYHAYMYDDISFDQPINEDGITLSDVIPSNENIEDIVMNKMLKTDILDVLEVLDDRYKDIIKMKFSLGEYSGHKYTVKEISEKYSVSLQRINEIVYRSVYLMRYSTKKHAKQKALVNYYYR